MLAKLKGTHNTQFIFPLLLVDSYVNDVSKLQLKKLHSHFKEKRNDNQT